MLFTGAASLCCQPCLQAVEVHLPLPSGNCAAAGVPLMGSVYEMPQACHGAAVATSRLPDRLHELPAQLLATVTLP